MVPKPVLFKIFSGLASGLGSAQLDLFIANMHTALGAGGDLGAGSRRLVLRPRHVPVKEVQRARSRGSARSRTVRYYEEYDGARSSSSRWI